MSKLLERVNRTIVAAELLGEILDMQAAMPPAERGALEARALRLFELLDQKGLEKNRSALAVAIDLQLAALARLQRDKALRGWSLPGGLPGMSIIHGDVVEAAAREPLIERVGGEAVFDVESFRRRVLSYAQARGEA